MPPGYCFLVTQNILKITGCGFPICTIVDMRVKSFKSMCHLVEWMVDNSKYRQVFEIQKGSCIDTSKQEILIIRNDFHNPTYDFDYPNQVPSERAANSNRAC